MTFPSMRTKPRKRDPLHLRSNISVGPAGIDPAGLKARAQKNPQTFVREFTDLMKEHTLTWNKIDSLRALLDALIDVKVKVYIGRGAQSRSIDVSAFPIVVGQLIGELVMEKFDALPALWNELCTVHQTNQASVRLPDVVVDDVGQQGGKRDPGQAYPLITASDTYFLIDADEDGRRIAVTQDIIDSPSGVLIVDRLVNAIVTWAHDRRNVEVLRFIMDIFGSAATAGPPYVYRPKGQNTAYYTANANVHARSPLGNRLLSNDLVDGDSLQRAIDRIATARNPWGNRYASIGEMLTLLVPHEREVVAGTLLISEMTPDVANEVNPFGPRGRYGGRLKLVSTPLLSDVTGQAGAWAIGNFIETFELTAVVDMEYVDLDVDRTDYLKTRTAFQARIADKFGVGATSVGRVIQCLPGTDIPTAPAVGA